jgi:hypothetical protein
MKYYVYHTIFNNFPQHSVGSVWFTTHILVCMKSRHELAATGRMGSHTHRQLANGLTSTEGWQLERCQILESYIKTHTFRSKVQLISPLLTQLALNVCKRNCDK